MKTRFFPPLKQGGNFKKLISLGLGVFWGSSQKLANYKRTFIGRVGLQNTTQLFHSNFFPPLVFFLSRTTL